MAGQHILSVRKTSLEISFEVGQTMVWSDEHELPRAVKASLASPAVCTLLDCWSAKRNAKVTGRPI